MRSLLIALLIFAPNSFACDVLFLDFNNSGKEVRACRDGVRQNNPRDDVQVIGDHNRVTAASIESTFRDIEKSGGCIDSITISGHQIAGQFAGENGSISSKTLAKIIAKHPSVAGDHLETSSLLGCYSTVLIRCENDYLKKLAPSIKTAVGFTLQSPSNERRADWDATEFICKNREVAAQAQDAARLNDYLKNLTGFVNQREPASLAVGLCIGGGADGNGAVCSRDYHVKGEPEQGCYHTWDDLKRACGNKAAFDPNGQLVQMYDAYFAADDTAHAEPPGDKEDAFTDNGTGTSVKVHSPIRSLYAKANLWEHCASQYKHDFHYNMPNLGQMIRLDKFRELKASIQANNSDQLEEYNDKLAEAGLGRYKLRDLTTMNRKEIKDQLGNVLSAIGSGRFAGTANVDPDQLYKMANNIKSTLIDLAPKCSDGGMLHDQPGSKPSPCIKDYGDNE